MKRIAKFHKVSSEQFAKDWKDTFGEVSDAESRKFTIVCAFQREPQPEVQDMIFMHLWM